MPLPEGAAHKSAAISLFIYRAMTICLLPERTRRASAMKSKVRSKVEHVFAHQKGSRALVVKTTGLARAKVKIGRIHPVSAAV